MSKKITGDEPAHPTKEKYVPIGMTGGRFSSHDVVMPGLTIRPEFAARAMQGILSNTKLYDTIIEESNTHPVGTILREEIVAKESLMHADALIAELNKEV